MHRIRVMESSPTVLYWNVLRAGQGANRNQPTLTECEGPPCKKVSREVIGNKNFFPLKGKAGQLPWLSSIRKHSEVRESSPDTVLAPLLFRTQLDVMSISRNWQREANWCEKRPTLLLLQKLLNTSCLNLLVSMDALLMKPAACLVLLSQFKHLIGNSSVKFCTK